jgi:amino acid transporter
MLYAVAAVLALSAINIAGVQIGKWTQNVLTTAKVLGLCLVAVVGLVVGAASLLSGAPGAPPAAPSDGGTYSFGTAMIFVLFAYGGWNEMAYVGAEVRDPKKNILRALILGTVAVAAVYLAVTFGFLSALGLEGTRNSGAVAADVLRLGLGTWGGMFISLLIAVSALGSINGQIFTGARIYYAMGQQHRLYAVLGQWNPLLGTPVWSLLVQGAITLAVIVGFGWAEAGKGFSRMVIFTTPVFWFFLVLVGIGLLVLRYREPHTPRPYRVPLYPVLPLVFIASSAYMVYAGVDWALKNKSYEAFWAIGLLLLGVVMAAIEVILGSAYRRPGAAPEASAGEQEP